MTKLYKYIVIFFAIFYVSLFLSLLDYNLYTYSVSPASPVRYFPDFIDYSNFDIVEGMDFEIVLSFAVPAFLLTFFILAIIFLTRFYRSQDLSMGSLDMRVKNMLKMIFIISPLGITLVYLVIRILRWGIRGDAFFVILLSVTIALAIIGSGLIRFLGPQYLLWPKIKQTLFLIVFGVFSLLLTGFTWVVNSFYMHDGGIS